MGIFDLFESKKIKEEIDDLQQKYNLLKVDFDNKNQEVNKVRIEKIKLLNDVRDRDAEIIILQRKIKELEEDKFNLKHKITMLEENSKELEKNNSELKLRKQVLYREYTKLKENKDVLEEKNQEEERKNIILTLVKELKKGIFYKQQIIKIDEIEKEFIKKLNTVNGEKNELLLIKNDLEERVLRKEKVNERIKDELSKALKDNEVLNKETSEIKEEIFNIEENFKELEIEIDKKNIQIQDLTIKIENLTWQNKEKENKLLLEKQYVESLEKENKNYKNIYEKQIEALKEELTLSKKMYKELESNSKALELEWVGEKKKNNKILEELEEYKNKLTKLEEKLKIQEEKQEFEIKEEIIPIEEEKKAQENLKVERKLIDPVEKIIKRENISILKWNNHEEFIKNKDNLIEYLKSFSSEDFQNIYFQVKERGIIKKAQEKYFSNILIRIKLNLPLTSMDVEKIKGLYQELIFQMNKEGAFDIECNESLSFDSQLNDKVENEKIIEQNKIVENIVSTEEVKENLIKNENKNLLNKIVTFDALLELGLKEGEISIEELQKIDYEKEYSVYDIYEAIELLEERGIRINY